MQPGPFPHLPGVCTARVDDMLAGDGPEFALDHPLACAGLRDIGGAALAEDPHAFLPGALGEGHGDIGRIHMAVVGCIERPDHAIEIVERMLSANKVRPHKFDIEAKGAPDRERMAQPVHLILGIGKAEGAASVPCHGLSGFLLEDL